MRKKNFSVLPVFYKVLAALLLFALVQTPVSIFAKGFFSPSFANFSNVNVITITDRGSGSTAPNGVSNPYPSQIVVSGLSGTITSLTVTLNGYTAARPRDNDFVVVAPNGTAFMLMSDTGDLTATSNVNLTFSDSAGSFLPSGTGSVISSGTFKPTDILSTTTGNDTFPAPGPATIISPAPTGSATLASAFGGINPNGTWSLYAIDDALAGGNSSVSGGWALDITTNAGSAATTTSLTSSVNPSLTTQGVTFTAGVASGGNPVTSGTVSFTRNGTAITGCTNVALGSNGQAVCTVAANTLSQGNYQITATYSGATGFGTSSDSLTQVVSSPTTVSGSRFCNNGGVTLNDNAVASSYPLLVNVSGLVGTISKVTVELNGLTLPRGQDIDALLVAPGGQNLKILSDVGDVTAVSNINLTLDDSASSNLPSGSALTSGTFRPTDVSVPGEPDTFPSPAPTVSSSPAPTGTATFASVYNGTIPNGSWAVYIKDDAFGGGNGTLSGVCLNFTLAQLTTSVALTSSLNPSATIQPVTFRATVSATGGTPSGTVEFYDGTTLLGTGTLNASGVASYTANGLPSGTRSITARYLGANVGAGGGGFAAATSPVLSQVVRVVSASLVSVGGRVTNSGGRGIFRAKVSITDGNGNTRMVLTNQFGFYRFSEVVTGDSYLITVNARNRQFASRFVQVTGNIEGLDFVEGQ